MRPIEQDESNAGDNPSSVELPGGADSKRTMLPGGRALSLNPKRRSWRQSNM